MALTRLPGTRRTRVLVAATVSLLAPTLTGCGLFAQPHPEPASGSSLAPVGSVGYVVCTNAVTPVELATRTAEAAIPLPISGTPDLGNFAIATSSDGRWAYVVTSDGFGSRPDGADHHGSDGHGSDDHAATAAGTVHHRRRVDRDRGPERGHPHRPGDPAGRPAHPHPRPGGYPRHRGAAGRTHGAGRQREHHRPGGRAHPAGGPAPRPRGGRHHLRDGPQTRRRPRSTPWWPEGSSPSTPPPTPPGPPSPPAWPCRRSTHPTASP